MILKGTDNLTLVHQIQENNNKSTDLGEHHDMILARLKKERGLDLQSADIPTVPDEDDLVEFPFRQLSATIVGAGSWKATDFSKGNVLKKSMPMLEGVPAYRNHHTFVGNEVGHIGTPTWSNSYTNADGKKIPAGIDAPFIIDKILEPKLVRQLSSPRSPVKSSSVTVVFEWEASHDFDKEWMFWDMLGTFAEDGEMVRRIVTNITAYYESSLVWLGADPFAGKLDENGEVVEIDQASVIENSRSGEEFEQFYKKHKKYFIYSCSESEKDILLKMNKEGGPQSHSKTEKQTAMNKKLLEKIAQLNNCKVDEVTEEMIEKFDVIETDKLAALEKADSEVKTLKADKEAEEGKVKTLTDEKAQLEKDNKENAEKVEKLEKEAKENEAKIKAGEAHLNSMREHTKEVYTKFAGDKVDDTIVKEIEGNNIEELEAKLKLFGAEAVTKFGAHCTTCNSSEHISYRSSIDNGGGVGDDEDEPMHMGEASQIGRN